MTVPAAINCPEHQPRLAADTERLEALAAIVAAQEPLLRLPPRPAEREEAHDDRTR